MIKKEPIPLLMAQKKSGHLFPLFFRFSRINPVMFSSHQKKNHPGLTGAAPKK
jgi:hypothetical protein